MVIAERKEGMARSGWRVFADQCSRSMNDRQPQELSTTQSGEGGEKLGGWGEVAIAGSPNCPIGRDWRQGFMIQTDAAGWQANGEVQRRQITLNSAPAAFDRPLPRSVGLMAVRHLYFGRGRNSKARSAR
jgi:hypothetical protein